MANTMQALVKRYREPGLGRSRILWITRNEPGATLPGTPLSAVGSATWLDQGRPWAVFTVEDIALNVDVQKVLREGRR